MTTDTTCRRCGAAIGAAVEYCPLCGLAVGSDAEILPTATAETQANVPSYRANLDEQMLISLRDATLGEFEILSELGRGGMATVYLAHEIALNRKVAIKVISPHLIADNTAERFLREARTAAALSHPNLIPIFSVRETDQLLFFVMKFVAGPTVETLIKDGQRLPIPVIQAILSETASALGYAHRRQIVHRDVKPGNIMLDEEGRVVVTDFGIARNSESTGLTGTGMSVGTPMYMSPEQCLGDPVSGASDQYSLGIVGYQLITGKVPFEAPNAVAMMYAHMHTPPRPLIDARPDCPPQLAAAIMRMIEKNAPDRWQSMDEAIKAIGAPPLSEDDPARKKLVELAEEGAAVKKLSLPSTPQSPMPATRATPRRAPRHMVTPARGMSATDEPIPAGAATVRITPLESRAAAEGSTGGRAAKRSWVLPVSVAAVALLAVVGWAAFGRKAPAPVPATTTASAPTDAATVPATNPAVVPPAAPTPVPAAPTPVTASTSHHVASIAISPPVSELKVGEQVQLRALARDSAGRPVAERGVKWTTSDPGVVSVTSGGQLKGVAVGRTSITTALDGSSATLSVSVVPVPAPAPTTVAVASVEITPAALTLAPSATGQLRATAHDATGNILTDRAIQWGSANPRVADVSSNGLVIAVAPGSTQVIASVEGQNTSIPVNVTAPVVVAAPAAAPAPAAVDPTPGIKKLIEGWVAAIHSRDATRIIELYPTIPSKARAAWDDTFEQWDEVDASIVPGSVEIASDGSKARFDLTITLTRGKEHHTILQHVSTEPELQSGTWRFRRVDQAYKQTN